MAVAIVALRYVVEETPCIAASEVLPSPCIESFREFTTTVHDPEEPMARASSCVFDNRSAPVSANFSVFNMIEIWTALPDA